MEPPASPDAADRGSQPTFANPKVADHINNPRESQLKSFFVNLGIVTGALIVLLALIFLAAYFLTPFIPFRWERELIGDRAFARTLDDSGKARQRELDRLAAKLTAAMDLPAGMAVAVHYHPDGVPNAFATLGGNVIVCQGLIDLMESEDELAMVMAHEIGHIKNRDPVRGIVNALGVVFLLAGIGDTGGYADKVATLGMAGHSRRQETAADLLAVRALGKAYGNAAGAEDLFRSFAVKLEKRLPGDSRKSYFGSLAASHPDTLYRLERAREEAERLHIPMTGGKTPLSPVFGKSVF